MKNIDLIASGYVSFDRIIKVDRPVVVGQTATILNPYSAHVHFGGCSVNICYLLAKLQKNVLPLIRVGNDAVNYGFYDYLKEVGVMQDTIRTIEHVPTSHAYLIEDTDIEHITLFHPGAMDGKFAKDLDDGYFKQARYALIVVGSEQDSRLMLEQTLRHGLPLLFGMRMDQKAFPDPLLKEIVEHTAYLFMNRAETKAIMDLFDLKNIEDLFEHTSLVALITTLGSQGSIVYERTNEEIINHRIDAVKPTQLVDAAGAGDAYIAGFAYGLMAGMPMVDCASFGSTLASFVIEAVGCTTGAPTLEAFMRRHKTHFGGTS